MQKDLCFTSQNDLHHSRIAFARTTMAQTFDYGVLLRNGSRIVHGEGSLTKDAFAPELNIPGRLEVMSPGHRTDPRTPCFAGPTGCIAFTTETRMPRHVHMSQVTASEQGRAYVVEKIFGFGGVGLLELGGEVYVIPPRTLVIIGAGVPHAWMACPPGLDLKKLGISPDEEICSDGNFHAFYEYEEPTAFYPTAQIETLKQKEEYVKCDDLQSIRFARLTVEEIVESAWFVWGRSIRKAAGFL